MPTFCRCTLKVQVLGTCNKGWNLDVVLVNKLEMESPRVTV